MSARTGSSSNRVLGATAPGQVNVTGNNAQIDFEGDQTFDDAVVDIGNSAGNSVLYSYGANAQLTFGVKLTIDQTGRYAEIDNYSSGSSITNEGTIDAELAGGTFTISGQTFVNSGTIDIANDDLVDLGSGMTSLVNTGAIDIGANSTLNLQGTALATADLGEIADKGTLIISGTLANTGETFTVPGATTLSGKIIGGTVDDLDSELTFTASGNATLNGVTYVGTLDLTGTSQTLYVGANGLVVEPSLGATAPGQVNVTGNNAQINFEGDQTFDDAVVDIGNSAGNSVLYSYGANAQLTFGAKLTIDQTGRYAEIANYSSGSSTTNEGTIEADFANGAFTISGQTFANSGTIDAANGDTVDITATLDNYEGNILEGGTFEADSGSQIDMTTLGVVKTDQSDLILSGTGSIQSGNSQNNQTPESLAASLTTIGASGELELKGGAAFTSTNAFTNDGTLDLQSGTFTAANFTSAAESTLEGYGTVADAFTANGSVVADGGTLALDGAISGTGALTIDANSTLELGGADAETVNFAGAKATLKIDDSAGFSGTLAGLVVGDAIDLSKLSIVSAVVNSAGTTLTATQSNNDTLVFQLSDLPTGDIFTTKSDNAGGTLLTLATPPAPVIEAPASLALGVGQSGLISVLSISDSNPGASETFTVTLTDADGDFVVLGAGGQVTGSGTNALTITGSYAEVNTDLASLNDTEATAGTATIAVGVTDSNGDAVAPASISVDVAGDPVIVETSATATVAQGQATAISGVSLSESGAGANETFTATLADTNGDLSTTGALGTITGQSTTTLKLVGTLAQVNADLAGLRDNDPSTADDTIDIGASDSFGNAATPASVAVSVTAAPTATIDAVDGDREINAVEAEAGVVVTGTSTGLASGATLSLTVVDGGFSQTYQIVAAGGHWSAMIPAADATKLAEGTAVFTVSLNGATLATENVKVVETLPTVTISQIDGNDVINAAESAAAAGIALSGTSTGLAVGAIFTVSVTDGGVVDEYSATVGAGGAWTATMPAGDVAALAAGAATVSAQASDAYGNVSAAATQNVTVATNVPVIAETSPTATVAQGQATAISGLSLSETDAGASEIFSVTVSDTNGYLSTTGETVTGQGATTLKIVGTLAQVNADLAALEDTDSSTAPDTIAITASDAYGNAAAPASIGVTVTPAAKPGTPSINAPAAAQFGLLHDEGGIAGVSISESNPASNETFTVTLTDTRAGLSTTQTAGTVTGENSNALKIVGTLAQVNGDLATLQYGPIEAGSDTIDINASDSLGGKAAPASVAVSFNGEIDVALPKGAAYVQNQASAISGLVLSESGNTTGEPFSVTLQAFDGVLSTTGAQGKISGNGKSSMTISGTLTQINQDLAALSITDASATTDAVDVNAFDSIDNESATQFALTAETVSLNSVDGDNAINYAEAADGVTLSGTSTGFAAGTAVSVSVVDGTFSKTYAATVGANGAWSATMPKADAQSLAAGTATVTATIGAVASAPDSVTVAETQPTVTIAPVEGDNTVDAAEAASGFTLSGTSSGLAAGASVNVTINEGTGKGSVAIASAATIGANGAWTADISASQAAQLFNGAGTVSVIRADAYGNKANASENVEFAPQAPVVTIAPVDGDNEITSANAAAGVTISGTVTGLVSSGSTFTVNFDENAGGGAAQATATVGANGAWTATISSTIAKALTNGAWTVYAQMTDAYGNISNPASDVVTVDLNPGPPVVHWFTPVTLGAGEASPVSGITLTQSNPTGGETQTVNLADPNGALGLSGSAAAGSTVTGQGTHDLTISGSLAVVDADLALVTDKEATAGTGAITLNASDSDHQAAGPITINLTINGAPLIAAPANATIFSGEATSIPGFSLSETGNTGSETFTVTLTDANGLLTTAGTAGTIVGSDTTSLTISGTLAQVNGDLTQIFDADSGSAADTIQVVAQDGFGNGAASKTVAVTPETASTAIVITTPAAPSIAVGQETAIPGIIVTDASAGANDAFSVIITDTDGLLSDDGVAGTVKALTTRSVQISGTLAQLNADLAILKDKDSSANPDMLAIVATDTTTKSAAGASVGVTVIGAPVITAPATATVTAGLDPQTYDISGLSLSESNAAANEAFTATLAVSNGAVAFAGATQGTVTLSNSGGATLSGTLGEINSDLQLLTFSTPTATSATIKIAASDSFGNTATAKSIVVTIDTAQVSVQTFNSEETSLNAIARGFDIADTGVDVASALSALQADASHVDAIDVASGAVSVTVAQFTSDETILNKISGGFDIADAAANVQADLAGLEADESRIDGIDLSSGSVSVTVAAFQSDETVLNRISGGFDIADTAAHVQADLTGLEADASHIGAIDVSSGTVSVSIATYNSDAAILYKIAGGFDVAVASTQPQSVLIDALSDLQLQAGPHLDAIVLSGQTISVSVQTYAGDAATLNKITGGPLDISDTGADVAAGLSALEAYASHIHAISLTSGVVDVDASQFGEYETALNLVSGGFELSDLAANIASEFASLKSDVAAIKSIVLTDSGTPVLSLTSAQASGDASLLAKISGGYVTNVANSVATTTTGHGNGLTINDAPSDDMITGGGNDETFVFDSGFGTAALVDFHSYLSGSTHDTIELQAAMFGNASHASQSADFAALLGDAKASGANVVITDTAGDKLTLDGVSLAVLKTSSADFKFT